MWHCNKHCGLITDCEEYLEYHQNIEKCVKDKKFIKVLRKEENRTRRFKRKKDGL